MEQSKKDCLQYCKFYKGEDESCFESKSDNESCKYNMFWFYEKAWCGMSEREHSQHVKEYVAFGLADFQKDDNTPISLKALLFNRFCHWCGGYGHDAEGFKEWYFKNYRNNKD